MLCGDRIPLLAIICNDEHRNGWQQLRQYRLKAG
jgi:hypothetical protein